MRRVIAPWLAVLAIACVEPGVRGYGTFESPCQTSADCESGLCLDTGDYRMCAISCTGSCWDGYWCADVGRPTCREGEFCSTTSMCLPDPTTSCRQMDRPCGSDFAPCCGSMVCGPWPDAPWTCTPLCVRDSDCATGCCYPTADGSTALCAPPHLCR